MPVAVSLCETRMEGRALSRSRIRNSDDTASVPPVWALSLTSDLMNFLHPDDFARAIPAVRSTERAAQRPDVWSGRLDEQPGEMNEHASAK